MPPKSKASESVEAPAVGPLMAAGAPAMRHVLSDCLAAVNARVVLSGPSGDGVMVTGMATRIDQPQVVRPVVQSVAVDMVNVFCGQQGSAKKLLHYDPMLVGPSASRRHLHKPIDPASCVVKAPAPYRPSTRMVHAGLCSAHQNKHNKVGTL